MDFLFYFGFSLYSFGLSRRLSAEVEKHPDLAINQNKSFTQTLFEDRPLSGITYVKNTLRHLDIVPSAHAQQAGFGFSALDPILTMWQQMRNVAYSLLILATLILAFMVMFRVKISPQLVITAQSAIPKLITGVILVTFSYAIAGFLIDLMYVVIGLVSLSFGWPFSHLTTFPLILSFPLYAIFFLVTALVVTVTTMGALFTTLAVGIAGFLLPLTALIMFLVVLVVAVLLIIHFFRTLFMLLRAFANIILLTIFAPLQIMAGTVVESLGFNAWLRSFISNLSVFVVAGILLNLSIWFLGRAMFSSLRAFVDEGNLHTLLNFLAGTTISDIITQDSAGWPPLLSTGTDQGVAYVFLGASFVTFTLIPRTTEIIQGLISGRQFAYGTAIGEFTGGPISFIGSVANIGKTAQGLKDARTQVFDPVERFLRKPPGQEATPNSQPVKPQPKP